MRAPLLAAAVLLAGCSPPLPSSAAAEKEIAVVIDDWHDAAAKADEARYFKHFAPNGVFLGTDATERWDVEGFKKYAHPHFARGKAWAFTSTRRVVTVDQAGAVAWFDEDLATTNLGPCRGSGVLVREGGRGEWKISQYNLAVTVPNDRFPDVKKILEGASAPR